MLFCAVNINGRHSMPTINLFRISFWVNADFCAMVARSIPDRSVNLRSLLIE
jgi:hypothetical protein